MAERFIAGERMGAMLVAVIAGPLIGLVAYWNVFHASPDPCEPKLTLAEISVAGNRGNVNTNDWRAYRAHYNLGYALAVTGKPLEACKLFRFCVDNAPKGSMPWNNSCVMLAVMAEQVGEFEKANALYALYLTTTSPMIRQARTNVGKAWEQIRKKQAQKPQRPPGELSMAAKE